MGWEAGIPVENIGIGTRTVNGTYGLGRTRVVRRPARIAVAEAGCSWVWKNSQAGGLVMASLAAEAVLSR